MKTKKNIWPIPVTFSLQANYVSRIMVRFYEFSAFANATTCKACLPEIDYLGFLLAFSCGFHFCLASLAP